jgi:hypothetical protein
MCVPAKEGTEQHREEYFMKKTWIALLAALCVCFSGCGGQQAASSASAPASEAAVSSTEAVSVEAEVSTEPEEAAQEPQDPEELGRYVWELVETANAEVFAVDYDMTMDLDIDLDGDTSSQRITGRVQEINQDDSYTYYQSQQYMGTSSETWYQDGTVYLSDSNGDYKAPMDLETFQAQNSDTSGDLLELSADSFGTLTGEETDSGYSLTFGDVSLDAWQQFAGLITQGNEDSITCEALSIDGTLTCNAQGQLSQMDMTLTVTCDILGMKLTETVKISETVNSYDDAVTINIPSDAASFTEIGDINIPTLYLTGYETLLNQDAMSYQSTVAITLTDGTDEETYVQMDTISYIFGEDGLSAQWDSTLVYDQETVSWSSDVYSDGAGTITTEDGAEDYTYDDSSYLSDIVGYLSYYGDSFDYGSDYQLEQDEGNTLVTYTLDSDYVFTVLAGNLESLGLDTTEATLVSASGTMSLWFDASGLLCSQLLEGTVELDFDGIVLTATLQDGGVVAAVGDAVTLDGSNH